MEKGVPNDGAPFSIFVHLFPFFVHLFSDSFLFVFFDVFFANKNIVKKISMWYDDTVLYLI